MTTSLSTHPASSVFADASRKGISIAGWVITTIKLPILNAPESDAAAAALHLPLPEICFGNNRLRLEHEASGLAFEWDALGALKVVDASSEVKVAHAAEWARGQAASGSSDLAVQKPFDWTYTSLYPGAISRSAPQPHVPTASTSTLPIPPPELRPAPSEHPGIPLHLLARQDIPILFFDEVPLFEDELGDNGIAELVVRVRVNATSVFILSRFFLRVDHVLFRIYDVRLYHAFGSKEVIRETKGRQATYDAVKKRLPLDNPDDLKPLTDVNWVASVLESLAVGSSPPRASGATRVRPSWPPKERGASGLEEGDGEAGEAAVGGREEAGGVWKAEGRVLEVLQLE